MMSVIPGGMGHVRCGGGGEEGAGELVQGSRLEAAAACSHTVVCCFFSMIQISGL